MVHLLHRLYGVDASEYILIYYTKQDGGKAQSQLFLNRQPNFRQLTRYRQSQLATVMVTSNQSQSIIAATIRDQRQ